MRELTLAQARNLQLAAQGLLSAPVRKASPAALLRCIDRMCLLQIDTIHVVARSPYLVLFSRLGAYPVAWLDRALQRAELFETWAHEACFAPVQAIALHRGYNRAARSHWGLARGQAILESRPAHLRKLLDHIRSHGPVKSSDFARSDGRASGWWGWKDEKIWLEALFANGELMVARRENFHRVYDIAERVHPALSGMALPDATDAGAAFVEQAITALGITQARWIHDYFRTRPRLKDADLQPLVEQGRVQRVAVQGWSAPGYVSASHRGLLARALAGKLQATHTTLLSPFDPLVWDRERALAMFGFDYRIECYTPSERRVYGYFSLPLLHCGQLVGRLDAKAHRAEGVFEVKALFLEPGTPVDDTLMAALARAIQDCADWHATPRVELRRSSPGRVGPLLRRVLRGARGGS